MRKSIKKKRLIAAFGVAACMVTLSAAAALAGGAEETGAKDRNTPSSLWRTEEGIAVQSNTDVPQYAKNGYLHNGKYISEEDLEDWQKNGVKVTSSTENNYLTYSNMICVDGFTKDDRLVEILPLTSIRGALDFSGMQVLLTDADDETNWVRVSLSSVDLKWADNGCAGTYVSVATSTDFSGGYRWGYRDKVAFNYSELHVGYFSAAQKLYSDKTQDDMLSRAFSVRYDESDKAIYVSGDNEEINIILDMDDPATMGGKEWKGFKNNRIRLSLKTSGLTGSSCSYMILNTANHAMNGETYTDETQANALISVPASGIPAAQVNLPYPIFNAEFYDFYDGALPYEVSVRCPKSKTFETLDNVRSFTPAQEGLHTVRYSAKDKSGNEALRDFEIMAYSVVEDISLMYEKSEWRENYFVGTSVKIPSYEVSGGSGYVTVQTRAESLTDGRKFDTSGGSFVPDVAGEYRFVYEATDYLGRVKTIAAQFTVKSEKQPVYESAVVFYEKFADKVPVELPAPNAYDYDSYPGQKVRAKYEIVARGTGDKADYSETIEDLHFAPSKEKFGDKVIVEYSVYCEKYYENALKTSFETEIFSPEYIWDYFLIENAQTGYNSIDDIDKFVSLAFSSAAKAKFLNPLRAEDFELWLSADKEKMNFTTLAITLTDFSDAGRTLRFVIENTADAQGEMKSYLRCNGETRVLKETLGVDSLISLKYYKGKLLDYSGNTIYDLSSFAGFPSGKVWVSFEFGGVNTASVLKLKKIGAQMLNANYSKGELRAFTDILAPEIQLTEDLNAEPEYEARVKIPYAKAFDVCTQYLTVTFTLTAPDGTVLFSNEAVGQDKYFTASQYGEYTLTYYATDYAKKTKKLTYVLNVLDKISPVIVYDGERTLACRLNDTLNFAAAKVYDDMDTEPSLSVLLVCPDGTIKNVTAEMKYTFTQGGKYVLHYYACDKSGNYAISYVTIYVSYGGNQA